MLDKRNLRVGTVVVCGNRFLRNSIYKDAGAALNAFDEAFEIYSGVVNQQCCSRLRARKPRITPFKKRSESLEFFLPALFFTATGMWA
jgi:hypothetical protein